MRYAYVPESVAAHDATLITPPAVSWPSPTISSLDTQHWDCWPPMARSLAKLAESCGWRARTGFARGYVPGLAAGAHKMVDSLAVWLDGYGYRICAWWERDPDGEHSEKMLAKMAAEGVDPAYVIPTAYAWSAKGSTIATGPVFAFPYANHTELKEFIRQHGDVPPSWRDTCQERVLAARAKAKAAAHTAPAREHS